VNSNPAILRYAVLVVMGLVSSGPLHAQKNYPTKPIRLIVPFAAGGASDIVGRIVQPKLSEALGQQVIIDNRGGAAGIIGTGLAANAQPDGYTIVLVPSSHAINQSLYEKLPFDSIRSFAPVILLDSAPLVIAVHPSLTARSVPDLIKLAKSQSVQLNYPSGGIGSGSHLGGELFAAMAQVQLKHIPYKGLGPALIDLLAGRTQLVFSPPLPVMPHIKTGKLVAIAHTGPGPSKQMPGIPPASDTIPGYQAISWHGILAPAGTPKHIITRLNKELNMILGLPEIAGGLSAQGLETGGGTPEQFGQLVAADIPRFAKVIKGLGIRADNL